MKSANSLADLLAEVIPANLYQTVVEDLASSGPWAPLEIMGKPSTLRDKDPEDLDALLRLQNPRDGDKEVREIFSLWLSRVSWAEGENESRLETILWTLRQAQGLGDHASVDRLRSHLKRLYDVTHFPTNPLSARTYARTKTRNYKAMSRDWRRAGWGLHDPDYQDSKPIVKAKPTVEWDGWD